MATTEQNRTTATRSDSLRPKIITSTEARRGFMTTEFWLSLLVAAALVIAGYADDDGLAVDQAWALAAGVIAAYALSRGLAKAGSGETDVRDIDIDGR